MASLAVATQPPARSRWTRAFNRYYGLSVSIVSVLGFLLLWEVAAERGWINARFSSQPSLIWRAAIHVGLTDDFAYHCWVSFAAFALGFAMALVVSVPLGLYLGASRRGRLFIEPPLMALYTAPRLALLPILIVWLGIGLASKVAVVFLGAVFPILVNTMAGVRSADHRLVTAARAFGASKLDIFVKVLVPGSLPAILMGVRLGVGRGVLSVVVGEMFVSEAGIGYQIMTYGQSTQFDNLLVYAFTISLFGYALTVAVRMLEDRIRSWRPAS
jgi:ABC-type nitrate/sulfonate/bicarbonate transport system permease component